MRCPTCDYSLWNLPNRTCPECGTGFKPSEFSFEPDSVRYLCPHCGQDYYGTDAQGHLSPRAFDCVKCARRIDMDEMVLLPAPGVKERETRPDEVPWLEKHGVRNLFRTIGWAMFQPQRLAKALPGEPHLGRAVLFATLANTIFVQIGAGALFLFGLGMVLFVAPRGSGAANGLILGALLGALVIVPLAFAFLLLLWSFATHGLLCLFDKPVGGHARTLECLSYASGANTIAGVPCIGGYAMAFTWIWWAVSASIMLRQAHRVRGWAAAAAAVLPPLLIVGAIVGLFMLIFAGVIRQGMATSQAYQQTQQLMIAVNSPARLTTLDGAVSTFAGAHDGTPPENPLELVASGDLPPEMLIPSDSVGVRDEQTPAGQWLAALAAKDEGAAAVAIAVATADISKFAPCLRVGDFIFIRDAAGVTGEVVFTDELWVVICLPKIYLPALTAIQSPVATSSPSASTDKFLLKCDTRARGGRSESFYLYELETKIENQNSVRTSAGLPALPDLSTVPEIILPPGSSTP